MKTLVTIIRPVVALAGLAALAGRNGLKPTSICCQRGSIQNALFGGNRRSLGASSMADFEPVTNWIRRPDPAGKVGAVSWQALSTRSGNLSNGWRNSTTPGANPPPPPSGNRNWPRSIRPTKRRKKGWSREPQPLWTAMAERSGDTAFGTRGKLSKFGNCSPARKRRRVRLASALQNLADCPTSQRWSPHRLQRFPFG